MNLNSFASEVDQLGKPHEVSQLIVSKWIVTTNSFASEVDQLGKPHEVSQLIVSKWIVNEA